MKVYFYRWESRSVVFGASVQYDHAPTPLLSVWLGFLFWDFHIHFGKTLEID